MFLKLMSEKLKKLGSFSLLMNKPNIFIGINNNQGLHFRTVYGQMSKINQLNILIFWVLVTFLEFWWNLSILDWCQCPIHTNLEKKRISICNWFDLLILCPIYKGDLVKGSSEGRLCGIPLSSTNESLVVCPSAIEVQFP